MDEFLSLGNLVLHLQELYQFSFSIFEDEEIPIILQVINGLIES